MAIAIATTTNTGVANKPHLHPNVLSFNKEFIYDLVNNLEGTMDAALKNVLSGAASIDSTITKVEHHYGELDYDPPETHIPTPKFNQLLLAPPTPPTLDIGALLSQFMVQITSKLDENTIKLEEQSVKVDRAVAELKSEMNEHSLQMDARFDDLCATIDKKLEEQASTFDGKLLELASRFDTALEGQTANLIPS